VRCPFCGEDDTRVLDSRPTDEGSAIRRRRECPRCKGRFTSYERIEEPPVWVVKKDGRREAFERAKILRGILTALEKRPIPLSSAEGLARDVEGRVREMAGGEEVPSHRIGEFVMEGLRHLDEVAYIRFASVYREFKDVSGFREEIERLATPEEDGL